MGKKIFNPFVTAWSIEEFFKLLRAELERLYDKKLRTFKVESYYINVKEFELRFKLTADGYKNNVWTYNWLDVAEARAWLVNPTNSHRWEGYNLFKSTISGATNGKQWCHAAISLRHLPKIAAMVRREQKRQKSRANLTAEDPIVYLLEQKIKKLKEQIYDREAELLKVFDKKNPEISFWDGMPEKPARKKKAS